MESNKTSASFVICTENSFFMNEYCVRKLQSYVNKAQ